MSCVGGPRLDKWGRLAKRARWSGLARNLSVVPSPGAADAPSSGRPGRRGHRL
eukprot:SM000042S15283  [mRNA]  locus=s42:181676:181834:+ [translate_table: standard]